MAHRSDYRIGVHKPVSVNKVLLEYSHDHLLGIVYGCLQDKTAELREVTLEGDHGDGRTETQYCLALYRKAMPIIGRFPQPG